MLIPGSYYESDYNIFLTPSGGLAKDVFHNFWSKYHGPSADNQALELTNRFGYTVSLLPANTCFLISQRIKAKRGRTHGYTVQILGEKIGWLFVVRSEFKLFKLVNVNV